MSDPRRAEVWGKKPEVAERTLNERKYCKVCDYYYSEMFTCPICYGADRERERIVDVFYAKRRQLEQLLILAEADGSTSGKWFYEDRIKELDRYIELTKGEQK